MKNFVYANILGITKNPQLTAVRINRPLLDISSLKYSKGTFRISDYIAIKEFEYLEETSKEFVVTTPYTISHKDDKMWLNIEDGDFTSEIPLGSEWWIRNEKVNVLDIFYNASENITSIRFKRGVEETVTQDIIGEYFKYHYLNDVRYNPLMYEYKIANFKRDFRGLIVELTNDENSLVGVGVIKSLNVTNGVAVIDCEDLQNTIGIGFDKMKWWSIIKFGLINDSIMQYLFTVKGSSSLVLGGSLSTGFTNEIGFNFFNNKSLRLVNTPIFRYLNIETFRDMKASLIQGLGNFGLQSPDEITKIKESLDFVDINVPNNKSLFDLMQFFSGHFLSFNMIANNYEFKNIIGMVAKSNASINDARNLMNDLLVPKIVATQFEVIGNIEIKWADRSTFFSITDFAGINGSNGVFFELFKKWNALDEIRLRETVADNYLSLQSIAVSKLKAQIPEKLIELKYQVGTRFIIKDIAKFYTFQVSGKEVFNYGTVEKVEKDVVTIIVTAGLYYTPVAPSLKVRYDRLSTSGNQWIYKVTNIEELLGYDSDSDLTTISPFLDLPYFNIGDKVTMYKSNGAYLGTSDVIDSDIAGINGLELAINATTSTEFEDITSISYSRFLEYNGSIVGINYNNLTEMQKNFFYLGVDRWV